MVKRYAVIDDATQKCVNVILLDENSTWQPPAGCSIVQSDTIQIHTEPKVKKTLDEKLKMVGLTREDLKQAVL